MVFGFNVYENYKIAMSKSWWLLIKGVTKVSPHCCQFCTFELGVKLSRIKRYRNYLYSGLCLRYCGYLLTQFQTCPHIRSVCTDRTISCYRFRPIGRNTKFHSHCSTTVVQSDLSFYLEWINKEKFCSRILWWAMWFAVGAYPSFVTSFSPWEETFVTFSHPQSASLWTRSDLNFAKCFCLHNPTIMWRLFLNQLWVNLALHKSPWRSKVKSFGQNSKFFMWRDVEALLLPK